MSGEDPTHHCAACDQDVILDADPPIHCAACGRAMLGDPEDDLGSALCGDCNRARNFDAIEEIELLDDDPENA